MFIKTTKCLRPIVGTLVEVIRAEYGAYGVNGQKAIIVNYNKIKNKDIKGLTEPDYNSSIFIEVLSTYTYKKEYWAIGEKVHLKILTNHDSLIKKRVCYW